ncbi:LuxR C-terminal-related transcriptional regulator [Oleomonas cavernae]|nr:LuxR C-terminal-related transcriptional regulator [Oleomonas cavernae]
MTPSAGSNLAPDLRSTRVLRDHGTAILERLPLPGAEMERPRITRLIGGSVARNLVTVLLGPPGTGKTVAMAAAMRQFNQAGTPCVSLPCTPADSDGKVFTARLVEAIGQTVRQHGGTLPNEPIADAKAAAALLLNLAARAGNPVCVFIDDFHHADDQPQRAFVVSLFHHGYGDIRIVAASHHRFRCGLGSLLLDSKLEEFGMADLVFSPEEARALFHSRLSPGEERALETLIRRTEGWPAALRIVERRLARGEDLAEIARDFSSANREFASFFDDLLAALPADLADFLHTVAPLDTAPAELLRVILGDNPDDLMARATEACPFAAYGDREERSLRLHGLWRDYLGARLARQAPARLDDILRKAADWYEARAQWVIAANYQLRAGRAEDAAVLLGLHADDIFARDGEVHDVLPLVEGLPKAVKLSPENTFWIGRSAAFKGDFAHTARLIEQAQTVAAANGDGPGRMKLLRLLVAYGFDDFDLVRSEATRWLSEAQGAPLVDRVTVSIMLSLSCAATLDPIKAAVALDTARSDASRTDSAYLQTWITIAAALQAIDGGNPALALSEVERALAQSACRGAIKRTCELVRAACLYEMGDLDAARAILDRNLLDGLRHGITETAFAGLRTAIRLCEIDQGLEAALRFARDAEHTTERRFGKRCRSLLRLARIEAILRQPDERRSHRFESDLTDLDVLVDSATRHCPAIAERVRLVTARRHIADGATRPALATLSTLMSPAATGRRLRIWAEACVLKAAAQAADGDMAGALKTLWAAIERAAPLGLNRTFVDDAALLRGLAPALLDHARRLSGRIEPACVTLAEAIARACDVSLHQAEVHGDDDDLPLEPLTAGEIKVLSLAASGLTNAQIAQQTLVAVPTIKWHLHNVFNKLGVKTRTAAIARGRQMGVLM